MSIDSKAGVAAGEPAYLVRGDPDLIVGTIRSLYGDSQEFHYAGPWGENGWLEDYVAKVDGNPIGCVALITRNAAAETQRLIASYRPRNSLLAFSRPLAEKLAGTPYAKYFQ